MRNLTTAPALLLFILVITLGCSKRSLSPQADYETEESPNKVNDNSQNLNYLALGDSYTIGTSVELEDNYPSQLSSAIENQLSAKVDYKIVAKAGWRTDELLKALDNEKIDNHQDLVTLLIGVNNQYQGEPFSKYRREFKELLKSAIQYADGHSNNVFVISIPDWGYTPYGQGWDSEKITEQINEYNAFAEETALENGVKFINITDITREGLTNENLVADDGLHPSKEAYRLFVDRMLPIIVSSLKN
ncbi:SGNH/GDSL hydrolase family protein [Euzebyella marina]|uniref:SGNH/GDSL hydrolase family protein n=1 Tax=Euzebyella marina TaxID=1761453 RepID=A0A3G2L3H9_9FLAO|nr:SGNH/GDSL hydrolase family protein [Euzebyella marina]AYN66756.1 SGNH/GDSL hydrolase family protein [Euzebyella marina]